MALLVCDWNIYNENMQLVKMMNLQKNPQLFSFQIEKPDVLSGHFVLVSSVHPQRAMFTALRSTGTIGGYDKRSAKYANRCDHCL